MGAKEAEEDVPSGQATRAVIRAQRLGFKAAGNRPRAGREGGACHRRWEA